MTTTKVIESPTRGDSRTGVASPAVQLKISCALTIGFALMISFGSHHRTDGLVSWFADLLFWPMGDAAVFTNETQLVAAILGGVMASWAVLFWLLTNELAHREPALLKRLILTTMAVWFVIDGAGSVASGAWLNLIGNLGFLAMFVIPARRLS